MSSNPPTGGKARTEEPVYRRGDLERWDRPGVWLAVLGYPVSHSISPVMHNAALSVIVRRNPEFAPWRYVRVEVDPDELGEVLPILHRKGFYGLNLTVPHKVRALDWVVEVDAEAARMGAVNTLIRTDDGYRGYNTDGYGLRSALHVELGMRLRGAEVLLLGAGGAARSAAVQSLKDGCRRLWIGNRSEERLDELLEALSRGGVERARLRPFLFRSPPSDLPRRVVMINATASGLREEDSTPILLDDFDSESVLLDMIYNPPETALMRAGRSRGMRVANGLAMLVYQGARSLEIWTQVEAPVAVMREAAEGALKMKST